MLNQLTDNADNKVDDSGMDWDDSKEQSPEQAVNDIEAKETVPAMQEFGFSVREPNVIPEQMNQQVQEDVPMGMEVENHEMQEELPETEKVIVEPEQN